MKKFFIIFIFILMLFVVPSCNENSENQQQGIQCIPGEDGHTPVITIKDGYWYIDGVNSNVLAEGVQGEAGLSAYEIFLKYYPDYKGTEREWIIDVAMGNQCNLFGHVWDEGVITIEATKGNDGEMTYTCLNCSEHKYEVIQMIEAADAEIYEIDGIKYVNYGSYPQTHVGNEALIAELNKLTESNDRGYYEYAGNEYAKVTTTPSKSGSYKDSYGNTLYYQYSDGLTIYRNVVEWFKVEPIKWRIISENADGSYQIYSECILDAIPYCDYDYLRSIDGNDIYRNNYKYSTIRAFLNGYNGTDYNITNYTNKGFYDLAFTDSEKGAIITVEVDNSAETTYSSFHEYACENTFDKIYLLSYQDLKNSEYGFTDNAARRAQVTDYAKAVGVSWNTNTNNGSYWSRSPHYYISNNAYYVSRIGNISDKYGDEGNDVYNTNSGVRAACNINLE